MNQVAELAVAMTDPRGESCLMVVVVIVMMAAAVLDNGGDVGGCVVVMGMVMQENRLTR